MHDLTELREMAMDRLNRLSQSRLVEALDYMDFLLERPGLVRSRQLQYPEGGPEDLLTCAGIWEFEPGELESILQDIERSRLMELEKPYDGLLA